jgi:hypothetical protein
MSTFVEQESSNDVEDFEQSPADRIIDEHGISALSLEAMADLEKDMAGESDGPSSPSSNSAIGESVTYAADASGNLAKPHSRGPSGGYLPPGAMPTNREGKLDEKAGEFWFPECMHCPCCKGYKHSMNCACRKADPNGVKECHHADCKKKPTGAAAPVAAAIAPRKKLVLITKSEMAAQASANSSNTSAGGAAPPAAQVAAAVPTSPPASLVADTKSIPCRSFSEYQSCRFGDSCRFSHAGGNGGPGPQFPAAYGGVPSGPGPEEGVGLQRMGSAPYGGSPWMAGAGQSLQRSHTAMPRIDPTKKGCSFFFSPQGCRNGENCRFSHDMSN